MSETIPGAEISPWWGIWLRPRQTIRQLVDVDPKLHFWVLAIFYGMVRAVAWSMQTAIGDYLNPSEVAIFILIGGPIGGIIGIYLMAALLEVVGRLFGGQAGGPQLRAVLAWAAVPMNVLVFLGLLPLLLMFGARLFVSTDPQVNALMFGRGGLGHFFGSGLMVWRGMLDMAGSIYYLVVAVIGYAEVQRFGLWKAVGTFFIVIGGLLLGFMCLAMLNATL